MAQFSNHRVLITGAGAGIGALMAEQFAAQGAEVIVTARRISAAREVTDRIKAAGGKAHPYVLDVSKIASIAKFRDKLHEEVGPITALINNAGVVFGGEFEQVPLEQHLNTFRINTEGLMATTHAFLDDLIRAKQGYLVNIASASAFVGLPYGSTYAASKWAVVGFSESIRLELDVRKIRHVHVTTVCPSYISTGMFDGVKTPLFTPMLTPEKVVKSIIKGMQKKDSFVIEPPIAKSTELLKAVLPQKAWDEVAYRMGVSTSMYSWKGKK
ncbi:short-chain dehydrogenase/reductase SDR [Alcanivorax hongdengensis A-11-3]|uniref:Short-chain dehydrogenase/reductase SDR n=1 Tax=Alcanivorax hongdengensis A-11-3 TaxID=1177179 RepID=L0W8K4_9GAMM|nr:SDR family NAD(P)-dependent oxidoreductase [Alcanivorax hongdengensis]EKF73256.1 short-chain dehydrogenase/reductase SDR [Alcanivorax hongdengensis A-11-3]